MSSEMYASTILKRYGMGSCRPAFYVGSDCMILEPNEGKAADYPYQQVADFNKLAAMAMRPDLAQAVLIASIFSSNPAEQHIKAVEMMMRYIGGSVDTGIQSGGSSTNGTLYDRISGRDE